MPGTETASMVSKKEFEEMKATLERIAEKIQGNQ
jgi:hypothetical protein